MAGAVVEDGVDGQAFTAPAWRVREWLAAIGNNDEEISLVHEKGATKALSKRGSGKFGSLDPKGFPIVDDTLRDAVDVGSMDATRLTGVLSYARQFVSDQETRHPPLVAVECREGILNATDSVGVVMVSSPILAKSGLRVHGKDVTQLLSFLSLKGSEEISLLEHPSLLVVRRADNHFIGIAKWIHEFPKLKIKKDEPPRCWFSVPTADLTVAIKYLGAFAKKDDNNLHIRFDDGQVFLSVDSASGDEERAEQPIPCVEHDGMNLLAEDGYSEFMVSKRYVNILAAAATEGAPLRFGINWVKNNGYITVTRESNGDEFFTLVVWTRKK